MFIRRYAWLLAVVLLLAACAIPGMGSSEESVAPSEAAPSSSETTGGSGNPTEAAQAPEATENAQAPVQAGSWEADDPKADLVSCATGDPVPQAKINRINPKVYVDVLHASLEEAPLSDAVVTIGGQMCAYTFTLDYGREINKAGLAEGEVEFTAGNVRANYAFKISNGKVFWEPSLYNLDTKASISPDNLSDFGLEVDGSKVVLTIPCYAVPRSNDQTDWKVVTYTRKADGGRLYCDEVGGDVPFPAPTVYWDGSATVTITDGTDDVMDMTHKSTNLHSPDADILSLQASLEPRNAPVSLTLAQFPPDPQTYTWSSVLRMNLSLVGPGQLICGRNEDGTSGWIDPKTLQFDPTNGLASFEENDNGPACVFAPPALSTSGCVLVSGDFYLKDIDTRIQYKDRVNGPVLCYQQP